MANLKDDETVYQVISEDPDTRGIVLFEGTLKQAYSFQKKHIGTGKKFPSLSTRKMNPASRKGTARPRRVSQITKKAPTRRLIARRKANSEPGYYPNPMNDPAKGALELAIVGAIKAAKTPVKLANKTDNMLTMQARLSFAQGLIQAAEIMGVFTRAETKLFLTQLKPVGVIGR